MDQALVSVAILSYKRRGALAQTLASVEMQSHRPREIIVVDNGSGDDIETFLRQNFPGVCLVPLPYNFGTVARNRGVLQAKGSLVVTLDNDVSFDSAFELQRIVNAFERNPEADCIAFKVLDASGQHLHTRDWCHPRSYERYQDTEFETPFITEGACAFRRERFLRAGGYFEPLFIGHEGWDLALRLLDRGGHIFYNPAIRVRHAALKDATRTSSRPYYYYTRNYFWVAARNYPFRSAIPFLFKYVGMMAYFSIREVHVGAFVRGIWDGLAGLPKIWPSRKPFSKATRKRIKTMSSERPGLIAAWRRHRERPQI
jgi:GT2 family glycosyltransferase